MSALNVELDLDKRSDVKNSVTMFGATDDNVIIHVDVHDESHKGKIIVQNELDAHEQKQSVGVVISLGFNVKPDVKLLDKVLFMDSRGVNFKMDGKLMKRMQYRDVITVLARASDKSRDDYVNRVEQNIKRGWDEMDADKLATIKPVGSV